MSKQKRFIACISDKGGSGKSVTARLLADWYHARGVKPLLVDGDGEVGQLVMFHGKRDSNGKLLSQQPAFDGVLKYALHGGQTDREKIAEILDVGADLILVDFPAAGLQVLQQSNDAFGFLDDIKKEGYKPTFINPITPFAASMRTVKNMIALGGNDSDYVVFKNEMFSDGEEDWIVWNGDEGAGIAASGGKKALSDVGGVELGLPKLRIGAMALIDEYKLTFDAAQADSRLPRFHRNYVQKWRQKVFGMLDELKPVLGVE